MSVGIIVVLGLACGGIIATGIRIGSSVAEQERTTVAVPAPRPPTLRPPTARAAAPSPSLTAPVTTVDGGPTTSFDLPLGTAVRFADQDGTWTVAVLGVDWIDECEDLLGSTVPVVVFDIRYEVTAGAVSVIPLNDFAFVRADGTRARVSLLSACAEPALDYTIVSAGEVRRGLVGIELPSGTQGAGGKFTYGQFVTPTASWTVPARAR